MEFTHLRFSPVTTGVYVACCCGDVWQVREVGDSADYRRPVGAQPRDAGTCRLRPRSALNSRPARPDEAGQRTPLLLLVISRYSSNDLNRITAATFRITLSLSAIYVSGRTRTRKTESTLP